MRALEVIGCSGKARLKERLETMKKRNIIRYSAAAAVLILSAGMFSGCGTVGSLAMQSGFMKSPYYHLGDTEWDNGGIEEYWFNQIPSEMNELYRELYSRLSNQEDEAQLYAAVPTDDFWNVYYAVLADHPELFWIGTNIQISESGLSGDVLSYQVSTVVPKEERPAVQARIEEAADACISLIPEGASEYDRIRMVYEYLIDTTEYDINSPDNQNIQSVLLNRRSVCAGYSRAFQYILHRMGMFCTYITGTTDDGGEHAWNVVRIGGEYYNVDVTWGDPVFAGIQEDGYITAGDVMNYNFLCCTDEELYRTHIPQEAYPIPACTDNSYNYYRLNGMYYETFDYDTIMDALMNSVWEERSSVTFKFGSEEAYQTALYEFFSNGMLQEPSQYLMDIYGTTSWSYRYRQEEEFCLITIYWKS